MYYYLLYDSNSKYAIYCILASNGALTTWEPSIQKVLLADFTLGINNVEAYLEAPDYPIIATYDQLPTIESHPELFL